MNNKSLSFFVWFSLFFPTTCPHQIWQKPMFVSARMTKENNKRETKKEMGVVRATFSLEEWWLKKLKKMPGVVALVTISHLKNCDSSLPDSLWRFSQTNCRQLEHGRLGKARKKSQRRFSISSLSLASFPSTPLLFFPNYERMLREREREREKKNCRTLSNITFCIFFVSHWVPIVEYIMVYIFINKSKHKHLSLKHKNKIK